MLRASTFLVCLALAGPASAQVVRISSSPGGSEANGPSTAVDISGTGRYVVFGSAASNLVLGDTNGLPDIFLSDRDPDGDGVFLTSFAIGGVVSRLSLGPGGVQANGVSSDPAITPDGRFVCFVSKATNLGPTAPAEVRQVYRLDRTTGTIVLVSANDAGLAGDLDSIDPVISDDGSVVAFTSRASTLVPGAATTTSGIFVREVAAGRTTRITPPGPASPVNYVEPRLSADGRRLVYRGINASRPSIFGAIVHDRALGTTQPLLPQIALAAFISASGGRAVTYQPIGLEVIRHALELGTSEVFAPPGGLSPIAVSATGRYAVGFGGQYIDMEFGSTGNLLVPLDAAAFDRGERWLAVATASSTLLPTGEDTNGVADVFVFRADLPFDLDHDGLDDGWESLFHAFDPAQDPDADGATNAQELAAGTHPTVAFRRFLAEGATGTFFTTDIALANPDLGNAAGVLLTFDTGAGTRVRKVASVPAGKSVFVRVGGLPGLEAADFSTTVESDRPIGIARTMAWDTRPATDPARGYGMHTESGVLAPSTTWFLAEGSTVLGFDLFYLLQNPQATVTHATIRFLLPSGSIVTRAYDLAPGSRTTVYVNEVAGLEETDVSGDISADAPIVVERAMYRSAPGLPFTLGTGGAGVTASATQWFLAEGATGSFFDLYVLIANPGGTDALVDAQYAKPDGSVVTRQYTVRAHSRFSVYVDAIAGLENTAVATTIISTNSVPIVVERAMYWPGGFFDYYEGHTSAGSTTTASRWVVAGGESGGPAGAQTFVLIANMGSQPVAAQYSVLTEPGVTPLPPSPEFTLPANSRTTFEVWGAARFGVLVTALAPSANLVVESAVYRSVGGVMWSAGGNALATPLP